jgi:hypothetical protein
MTELVLVRLEGNATCGVDDPSQTPLRSGWRAAQQCDCVDEPIAPSCGLMPFPPFPFSIFGAKPPLCEVQARNKSTPCDPTKCKPTRCKVHAEEGRRVL